MDNNDQIKIISQKPLKQVILEQGSELQQVDNHTTGKSFFQCGSVRGFIPHASVKRLGEKDASVEDFKIAMVSKNGELAIPTLLLNEKDGFKLVRTFDVKQTLAPNPPEDDMID